MIPDNIAIDPDETVHDFWQRRLDRHTHDTYRGRTLAKMPEDLRTYQHIIESSKPEVIVELGSFEGGSAVWFADQLDIFVPNQSYPRVISVDTREIDYRSDPRIEGIRGDLTNPAIAQMVREMVLGRRVMISEDSAHKYGSTIGALTMYSDLVSPGCWFVVEDGVVDDERIRLPRYPHGVQPAIVDFLATSQGKRFTRNWLAPYGTTTNIGGWLCASS